MDTKHFPGEASPRGCGYADTTPVTTPSSFYTAGDQASEPSCSLVEMTRPLTCAQGHTESQVSACSSLWEAGGASPALRLCSPEEGSWEAGSTSYLWHGRTHDHPAQKHTPRGTDS